jgi:hypothetical protein
MVLMNINISIKNDKLQFKFADYQFIKICFSDLLADNHLFLFLRWRQPVKDFCGQHG